MVCLFSMLLKPRSRSSCLKGRKLVKIHAHAFKRIYKGNFFLVKKKFMVVYCLGYVFLPFSLNYIQRIITTMIAPGDNRGQVKFHS